MTVIQKLLCWTAPGTAFFSAATLGFYLSSGSFLNAGLASLILLCSLALTIKTLPSPAAERQLWIECLFWLHATLSLALSFCSGYWFTETALWNTNHFYFWYALVAGILALGVRYCKQWVPIAFLLFYISVIAIPLGLIVYLLLFTGSMYKLFHAAIVFFLLALPTFLIGRWILWDSVQKKPISLFCS